MEASLAVLLALSFVLGAIPFGWIFAKLWGVSDLRKVGSSNVGATNVVRSAGKIPGFLTFFLDFLKCYLPMIFFECVGHRCPGTNVLFGVFAVLGHCYTPFLGFRGGKGVSSALGVAFGLNPWIGLSCLLAYAIGFLALRTSALGSLLAMFVFLLIELLFDGVYLNKFAVIFIVVLVITRHQKNWDKLLKDSVALILLGSLFAASSVVKADVVDFREKLIPVQSVPERVVALIPNIAEIIYDLDFGAQLVGVPEYTNIPTHFKNNVKVLGPYTQMSAEAIYRLHPNVVFASKDGNFKALVQKLEMLGLTVVALDSKSFKDFIKSMQLIAKVMSRGKALSNAQSKIESFTKRMSAVHKETAEKKKTFIQVGWNPVFTVSQNTFIHELLERAGGVNIFSAGKMTYPRPSAEEVIKRNPDVIIICQLTKSGEQAKKALQFWKQFKEMTAIQKNQIYIMPGDWITKPGFSLIKGYQELVKVL